MDVVGGGGGEFDRIKPNPSESERFDGMRVFGS
jgi:hypothetical protein